MFNWHALLQALIGVYSPSGRSPQTFYTRDAALPKDRGEMSLYPSSTSPGLTYRYFTPTDPADAPVFSFGEGLR